MNPHILVKKWSYNNPTELKSIDMTEMLASISNLHHSTKF